MHEQFISLLKHFLESYANSQNVSLIEWLASELQANMPEKSSSEIHAISTEIISTLELDRAKREELDQAIANGKSKEDWLKKEIKKSASNMSEQEASDYLHDIRSSAIKAQCEIIDVDYDEVKPKQETFNDFTLSAASREIQGTAAIGIIAQDEGYAFASEYFSENFYDGNKIIEDALNSGEDLGVKAAASGAFKTASERGIIPAFPANSPNDVIADVGFLAIENVKAVVKKLPPFEIIDVVERNAATVTAGFCASKGAVIGAKIGSVFGPAGAAAGGLIGGTVSYVAGSKVGEFVSETIHTVKEKVINTISSFAVSAVKKIGSNVVN